MNTITTFLQADWAERAGWALLHSLWQIVAVAALYAIAALLLRNRSANSRYALGCFAILAMLGLPMGTYVLLSHDRPLEIAQPSNTPAVAASPTESPARLSDTIGFVVAALAMNQAAEPLPTPKLKDDGLKQDPGAPQPKFAIYRVTGYRKPGDRPGTTKTIYFRDSGNLERFDPMRPKRYPLDGLILDGTPIISDSDLVAYEWRQHVIRLTPEAHNRLTKAVKPGGWGVPFVVQVEGTPVYLGAFWSSISSYTADMPTIPFDRLERALLENDPHMPANAIRIENSQVLQEGEFLTDPRQDKRVYRALGKAGKLLDLRSGEPPWGEAVEGVQSRLRSGVFRGAAWLKFDLRNDSRDRFVQLAPRGVPPEILVDNVPYRWSGRIAGAMPVCKPGQHVAGAALKLDKNWTAIKIVSGSETLELKPGKHTVQAIVYAAKNAEDGDWKVRVLSNPLEIDVPARQAESNRESGRLAIDLICTAPELRQVPSTWIGYELLSEDGLRERVTEIIEATPEVKVLVRAGRQIEHKHVAKLLDLLKTVGAKNVSLTVFPLGPVFALAPGSDRHGVIRGKVIGADNRGEPVKYSVTLEHEKWRFNSGELPNLVVSAGETFEFRNVPPGKCELRAQPIVPVSVIPPDRKTRPADAVAEVEVTLEAKQVVEVELSFGGSQASSVWGEAVEGVQFRLRCDRPRWHVDETIIFKIEVRNTGKRHLMFSPYAYPVKIDADGRLFSLTGTRGTARSYELKPAQEQTNIDFRVSRRREFKERPFQLEPGKHTVKITLGVDPAEGDKGGVLQVTSNPVEITIERALPGSGLSIDKAIEEEGAFAAVCEAVTTLIPTSALSPRRDPCDTLSQEFKVVEVLFGKAEAVDRIDLIYKVYGKERATQNHERVIWIGHTRNMSFHGSLYGLKALPDTPENRRAVKAAALQASATWSEAVEGVQIRLWAEKRIWRADEEVILRADCRNQGKRNLMLDGRTGCFDVYVGWRTYSPDPNTIYLVWPAPFEPGRYYRGRGIGLGRYPGLKLAPGKHTIHVVCKAEENTTLAVGDVPALPKATGMIDELASGIEERLSRPPVIVSSKPFEIEIVPAEPPGEIVAAPEIKIPRPEDADTAPADGSADEMNSAEKESAARTKLNTGGAESSVPVVRPADVEARNRFLEIERIARLPAEEQAKQLPHLYRDLAHPIIGGLWGMSSYRQNILDPRSSGSPEGDADETWAEQLADAAGEKSPEEMADAIESGNWLKLAARARALWVFGQHPEAIDKLLQSDLDSEDKSSVKRAASTIRALKRTSFSGKLLDIYLADDEMSKEVRSALVFMHDPGIVQPLLQKVEKDPRLLVRCAGLFQGPLYRQPADPMLLKLVFSADKEISYHAARALYECEDAKLAPLAAEFAKDPASRFRLTATYWAANLPGDAFGSIRAELLPLLADADEKVRFDALRCFAQQKDFAAGPVLLKLLKRDQLDARFKVTVIQAMSRLAGSTFNYYLHEWGPDRPSNQRAIEKFEAWLQERAKNAAWGKSLDGLRCRWIPSTKPVPVGTKPVISMEVENTSDKPLRIFKKPTVVENLYPVLYTSDGKRDMYSIDHNPDRNVQLDDTVLIEPGDTHRTTWSKMSAKQIGPARIMVSYFSPKNTNPQLTQFWSGQHGQQKCEFTVVPPGGSIPEKKPAENVRVPATKEKPAWGKPVEGVQARLQVFRSGAYSPDTVLKLLADVRNEGQRDLTVARAQQLCELEIDGRRYRWAGDVHVKSSWFPPGRQYEGIWIHLSDQWKCDDEPLVLKPGKHSVCVWFVANSTEKDGGEPVRFASNFVEIVPDDNLAVESLKKLGWRPMEKTNLIWDNHGRVSSIDIFAPSRDVHVTDAWLAPLKGMTELSRLILAGPQVTDAGLLHLKGLTKLGHLVLGGTQITDAGLVHLSGLTRLHRLELTGTKVTDAGLMHLKGLTNLQSLFLDSTRVTKGGAERLKRALPNVKVFLGEPTNKVTGEPVEGAAFGPETEQTVAYREGFPSEAVAEPGPMYLDLDTGAYAKFKALPDGKMIRQSGVDVYYEPGADGAGMRLATSNLQLQPLSDKTGWDSSPKDVWRALVAASPYSLTYPGRSTLAFETGDGERSAFATCPTARAT